MGPAPSPGPIATFIRTKRKAIAAFVGQAVTTALAWLGLHIGLNVDPDTAVWLSTTVGAAVTTFIVHQVRNEPF